MGYYARSFSSDILILRKNQDALISAVLHDYPELSGCIKEIDDVFSEFGLVCGMNAGLDIEDVYFEYGGYCGDDMKKFFNTIAPYVQEGSYITFFGDDDIAWAFYFTGSVCKEYRGQLTFPGMPIGGPKRKSDGGTNGMMHCMNYDCPLRKECANSAITDVDVVRCKDCRYARKLNGKESLIFISDCLVCACQHGAGVSYPEYGIEGRVVLKHDYCSFGKQKEINHE